MTYYEELGVASNAPASDIRQAYRVLARLVHPDGQVDEQVRGMAERQMKRLNDILATLLDAHRRREYDDSLVAPAGVPAVNAPTKFRPPVARFHPPPKPRPGRVPEWANAVLLNWFWIVPAAVILGVGCWYVAASTGRQAASLDQPRTVARTAPEAVGQQTRRDTRAASHPRVGAAAVPTRKTEPQPARSAPPAAPEPSSASASDRSAPPPSAAPPALAGPEPSGAASSGPPAPPSPAAPPAPAGPEPSSSPASARSAPASFAGAWLYLPASEGTSAAGVYPPTYVEFLLTEERGELSGSYRARYRIPDRAMSPEVLFRAQGKLSEGESAKLGWTSADGARGEVELRLNGPNAMSVTWWTTEFGRHPSLASGSAKLLRQQTP